MSGYQSLCCEKYKGGKEIWLLFGIWAPRCSSSLSAILTVNIVVWQTWNRFRSQHIWESISQPPVPRAALQPQRWWPDDDLMAVRGQCIYHSCHEGHSVRSPGCGQSTASKAWEIFLGNGKIQLCLSLHRPQNIITQQAINTKDYTKWNCRRWGEVRRPVSTERRLLGFKERALLLSHHELLFVL